MDANATLSAETSKGEGTEAVTGPVALKALTATVLEGDTVPTETLPKSNVPGVAESVVVVEVESTVTSSRIRMSLFEQLKWRNATRTVCPA